MDVPKDKEKNLCLKAYLFRGYFFPLFYQFSSEIVYSKIKQQLKDTSEKFLNIYSDKIKFSPSSFLLRIVSCTMYCIKNIFLCFENK